MSTTVEITDKTYAQLLKLMKLQAKEAGDAFTENVNDRVEWVLADHIYRTMDQLAFDRMISPRRRAPKAKP